MAFNRPDELTEKIEMLERRLAKLERARRLPRSGADAMIMKVSHLSELRSDNYIAGSSGWRINAEGNAEFNNIELRGAIIELEPGTVTEAALADGAVTNPKIADNAVDVDKIVDEAVGENQIAPFAVTEAKIGTAAVTNAKIADLAVTDAKVANMSVSKLLAGDLQVTEYVQSFGFVENPEDPVQGFKISGDGSAIFTDVTVGSSDYFIDSSGAANFQSLSVNDTDMEVGGISLRNEIVGDRPAGLIAFGSRAENVVFGGSETAIMEVAAELVENRMYRVSIPALTFTSAGTNHPNGGTPPSWTNEPARYSIRLRENGSSSPTTSSNLLSRAGVTVGTPGLRQYSTELQFVFACQDYALQLDGVTSTRAFTADHASLDITGDMDVRCEFNLTDWSDATQYTLMSKYLATDDNRSWFMSVDADRHLRFDWSPDGTTEAFNTAISTEPVPTDAWIAVRATIDVNNGAGGRTITFYTAPTMYVNPDEEDAEVVWEQLGDPVVQAGTTSIHSGTGALEIGGANLGGTAFSSQPMKGMIRRAELYNGIAGTRVAAPDFTSKPGDVWVVGDDAGDTNPDDHGRTWELGGNAVIGFEVDSQAATLSPGLTRFLLTADITDQGNGSDWAMIDTAGGLTNPIQIHVEDLGAFVPNNAVNFAGGTGGNPGGGTTTKKTYTKTYNATWSRSYRGDNSTHATNGELAQGNGSASPNGNMKSRIGFNFSKIQSDLSGADILKCEVYLYYDHWHFIDGGTAVIGTHNSTSTSATSWTSGSNKTNRKRVSWNRNQGKWVDLGTSIGKEFKSGAATGIVIGPGPSSSDQYYGKARGNTESNEPKLRITYRK